MEAEVTSVGRAEYQRRESCRAPTQVFRNILTSTFVPGNYLKPQEEPLGRIGENSTWTRVKNRSYSHKLQGNTS